MRRLTLLGMGVIWLSGCGSDPAPESKVGHSSGGSGGGGGSAGSLTLGSLGGGGSAGGGSGGTGAVGGAGGAGPQGGTGLATGGLGGGGATGQAGSSSSGGSQSVDSCTRAPGFDPECVDLFPDLPQAYTCSSLSAASMLKRAHDGACASISLVEGGKYNECCPP